MPVRETVVENIHSCINDVKPGEVFVIKPVQKMPRLAEADVARQINITVGDVRKLCKKGELRFLKYGELVRIYQDSVDEFIAKHTFPKNE